MKLSTLIWHPCSEKPRKDKDSIASSEPVVVTYDGQTIKARAIYDHVHKCWYDIGNAESHLIDEPKYWAYAVASAPEEPRLELVKVESARKETYDALRARIPSTVIEEINKAIEEASASCLTSCSVKWLQLYGFEYPSQVEILATFMRLSGYDSSVIAEYGKYPKLAVRW